MSDGFGNYSSFGAGFPQQEQSVPDRLFADYQQTLEGQGLYGSLQSPNSSMFGQSGSTFPVDDYSLGNYSNYSSASIYDQPIRSASPGASSTGGGSQGQSQSKLVGVVNPRPAANAGEGGPSSKMLDTSKSSIMSIINLVNEHVISHPFIVFRRQAQVNNRSTAFHLTPFTVIPFMWRIQGRQGVGAFFKGLPSSLVNYVLLIGSESLFYNLLEFPIEYDFGLNQLVSQRLLKHLALKALSMVVVTPFICSSSTETVQSLIVAESPSPLDSIKEGFARIFHFKNDRKLPFYMIVGPSVTYHLAYYVLYSLTREALLYLNRRSAEDEEYLQQRRARQRAMRIAKASELTGEPHLLVEVPEDTETELDANSAGSLSAINSDTKDILNELKCSLYANIITDIVLYPFQTVMYRLFLQGTRTLIDNVDGRTAVLPLISNYDSAADCYSSVLKYEGTGGLFKGFGALILQYTVQASLIHLANYAVERCL